MNCEKGDLAVIVKSYAGNEGKIVRCLELVTGVSFEMPNGVIENVPAWKIDQSLTGWRGGKSDRVQDYRLRPLRDNPGTDETLIYAGLPKKAPVPSKLKEKA